MDRLVKLRRADLSTRTFDTLYPQTMTTNVFRDNGNLAEDDMNGYDSHLRNYSIHMNRATSTGTASELKVFCENINLVDGLPILIKLHTDLDREPRLSFNGSPLANIIGSNGYPISGGQVAGTEILVVWSEEKGKWLMLNNDLGHNVTRVLIPVESEYIYTVEADLIREFIVPGFNRLTDRIELNFLQTVMVLGVDFKVLDNSHIYMLDPLKLRKGEKVHCRITKFVETVKHGVFSYYISTVEHTYTFSQDNVTSLDLPVLPGEAFAITLNYKQTILRNTIDYIMNFNEGRIDFINEHRFRKGDKLHLTITKYNEVVGVMPNNPYASAGTYRYKVDVIHEEFTAQNDGTATITVPNFNHLCDDLSVIKNNQMLINGVDYDLTYNGDIFLFNKGLASGETLYFTILKNAVVDVPTFAAIIANSTDGKYWTADVTYSELTDMYCLVVRLSHDLAEEPEIKFRGGPTIPIVDAFGSPLRFAQPAGSYLWIVYDQANVRWVCMNLLNADNMVNGISTVSVEENNDKTFSSGEESFIGGKLTPEKAIAELSIPHNLGCIPKKYWIQPSEPPLLLEDGTVSEIGDYWVTADDKHLHVGNTGTSTSKFKWFAEK